MVTDLSIDTFDPVNGSVFQSSLEGGTPVDLTLIEVKSLAREDDSLPDDAREPFSLLFRGPNDPMLEQMTYHLEHDSLGELDVFLVPIHPDADGPLYEAIFN